jgi:hypothetical protein
VTTLPIIICVVPSVPNPITAADKNAVTIDTRSAPVQTPVPRIVTIHKDAALPILIAPATVNPVDARLATVAEDIDITAASISSAAALREGGQ